MDNLVQDRIALLDPPQHWRPVKRRRPRRALKFATVAAGLSVALLAGSAGWAQITAPSAPYVFELEQLQISHFAGSQTQRRWVRIRADGVHEWSLTSATPWLSFLVHTTVLKPDGSAQVYAGPFPLPAFLLHGPIRRPALDGDCAASDEVVVGREKVFGRDTIVLEATRGYRFRAWRVPSLACEQLRSTVWQTLPDGSTKLIWEQRPVKVWP